MAESKLDNIKEETIEKEVLQAEKEVKEQKKKKQKVSKVNSGSISMYLAEIGKFEPLPPHRLLSM